MSQDFEFETRLRLALRDAADRRQQQRIPARVIAAAPSVVGALAAVIAVLAVSAIFVVGLHGPARPLPPPEVVARLRLADSLGDATVAAFGSVWLDDTTRNQLIRVDARTRRVVARLPVRGNVDPAAGAGALWVLEGGLGYDFSGPLLRIDPRTNRVTARIPLRTPAGKPFVAAGSLLGGAKDIWVFGQVGVLHIDPRTNRVTYAIGGNAAPDSLASFGGDLWMLSTDDRLLRFDARSGARIWQTRIAVPHASGLGTAGGALISTAPEALVRLDPFTGRVLWQTRLPGTSSPELASPALYSVQWVYAGGLIWAESSALPRDRLAALDPNTGRVITSVALSDFGTVGVASIGSELWLPTAAGKVAVLRR
jgi:PQQ-like domain